MPGGAVINSRVISLGYMRGYRVVAHGCHASPPGANHAKLSDGICDRRRQYFVVLPLEVPYFICGNTNRKSRLNREHGESELPIADLPPEP